MWKIKRCLFIEALVNIIFLIRLYFVCLGEERKKKQSKMKRKKENNFKALMLKRSYKIHDMFKKR